MKNNLLTKILVLLISCLATTSTFAQTTAGLTGNVTDSTGAVVAGAIVNIISVENGTTRNTVTDQDGFYTIQQLRPGIYTVKITQSGFPLRSTNWN